MKNVFLKEVSKNITDATRHGSDFMNDYKETYDYEEQVKHLLMDNGFDEAIIDDLEPELDYEVELEGFKESSEDVARAMEDGYASADTNLSPEEYVATYIIDYLIDDCTPILTIEIHVEPEDYM